ncbi:MAG: hypothetical protein KDE48_12535 [Anaerolineales bacterium]|nr:hypothetical protein [Anaerolineales bacterium]
MGKNNFSLTDQNLEHLSDFLNQIVANSTQNQQIPDGAHIFHGSADDLDLTKANIRLASQVLLGMSLGYVEEAPLIMVYESTYDKKI